MTCLKSRILIDDSAIEKIFLESEKVLENVEHFWETEKPYKLTLSWAPETYPIHFQEFKRRIEELKKLTVDERKKDSIYSFADKITEVKSIIVDKGLPLICSYLPPDSTFETNIYLASFIFLSGPNTTEPKYKPNAFVQEPNIVVNLSSDFWTQDENQLLNLMIHEIYHIGFSVKLGKHRPNLDIKTIEVLKKNLMWLLYFEGLATYVGYKALSLFPNPDMGESKSAGSYDYKMLEDPKEVEKVINVINNIFSEMQSLSYEEAEALVRNKGVMERAVYVVGAYMSKIIEEKKTKAELVTSLVKGPMELIKTYNDNMNNLKIII